MYVSENPLFLTVERVSRPPAQAQTRFRVTNYGTNKVQVIKTIRELSGNAPETHVQLTGAKLMAEGDLNLPDSFGHAEVGLLHLAGATIHGVCSYPDIVIRLTHFGGGWQAEYESR